MKFFIEEKVDKAKNKHGDLLIAIKNSCEYDVYAKSYLTAANSLLEQFNETQELEDAIIPIVFLYQHSLELFFKSIIGDKKSFFEYHNHDLKDMWNIFMKKNFYKKSDDSVLKKKYDNDHYKDFIENTSKLVEQLNGYKNGFRYPNYKGDDSFPSPFGIRIDNLKQVVNQIHDILESQYESDFD